MYSGSFGLESSEALRIKNQINCEKMLHEAASLARAGCFDGINLLYSHEQRDVFAVRIISAMTIIFHVRLNQKYFDKM